MKSSLFFIRPLQFDRALVVYSQGMRTRVELYATAFKAGAKKSKTAIMQTLKPLHLVPEHLWQGLGRQGRAFRSFVDQIFRMEEEEEEEGEPAQNGFPFPASMSPFCLLKFKPRSRRCLRRLFASNGEGARPQTEGRRPDI